MDPAAMFIVIATIVIILVLWGFERWREQQFEGRRREYHREVASGLVDRFEAEFGEGALSPRASPVEFHTWFRGELEGHGIELEVESASARDCRIRLMIEQGPIDLPEELTVYLKSPSGIGFFRRREAGMVDRLALPRVEGYLDVESTEGRVEAVAEEIPEQFVGSIAPHYENFRVEPPEELAERLRAADSLRDLEKAYEEVEAEEPTALQAEVPEEVGIRHDRIELAWLFRGDVENQAGLVDFVKDALKLAGDLEEKVGGHGGAG
jgi:hypothetical protein